MLDDLKKRRFIQVGLFAWVILLALAVTSPAFVMRRMGGKNWRRLHWLVYVAACGGSDALLVAGEEGRAGAVAGYGGAGGAAAGADGVDGDGNSGKEGQRRSCSPVGGCQGLAGCNVYQLHAGSNLGAEAAVYAREVARLLWPCT